MKCTIKVSYAVDRVVIEAATFLLFIKMSDYRRWYIRGGTTFFTLVTYRRHPLFADADACHLLGSVMRSLRAELPYQTVAIAILPDHLHAIWTLPTGDDDFSTRWKRIKRDFTVEWIARGGQQRRVTESQRQRGNRGIWQRRFYEHQIESEEELAALCDYIHYNPVKHGHAVAPNEWPYSTFNRFVLAGQYPPHWGSSEPVTIRGLDFQ